MLSIVQQTVQKLSNRKLGFKHTSRCFLAWYETQMDHRSMLWRALNQWINGRRLLWCEDSEIQKSGNHFCSINGCVFGVPGVRCRCLSPGFMPVYRVVFRGSWGLLPKAPTLWPVHKSRYWAFVMSGFPGSANSLVRTQSTVCTLVRTHYRHYRGTSTHYRGADPRILHEKRATFRGGHLTGRWFRRGA